MVTKRIAGSGPLEKADIVIVGGGCTGCSIAFNAAKLRPELKIVLVERAHVAWGATGKSSAIIRQHYSNPTTARMALDSLRVFENFPQIVGGDSGFVRTGFLLAVGDREVEGLKRNVQMQRGIGIQTEVIDRSRIEEIQPGANTSDIAAAAHEPLSGYADPVATTKSFASAAEKLGVTVLEQTKVLKILQGDGKVKGVRTEGGEIASDRVVNAANVWANDIMPNDLRLPIRVLREQNCSYIIPRDFSTKLTVWGDFITSIYMRPQGTDRLTVGSLESNLPELDDPDFCEGADYETVTMYSRKLCNRFPAMERGRWDRGWSGPYDVTPDWHPILDESDEIKGLFLAVGFSGHGFKLSPAVGRMMASLIIEGKKTRDLEAFAGSRFKEGRHIRGQYEANIIA